MVNTALLNNAHVSILLGNDSGVLYTILYCTVLYCTVLCCTVLCYAMPSHARLRYDMLCLLCDAVRYNTIL